MALKLERWDSNKTYMYPNGEIASPERINQDFPAAMQFTHVIEVNGDVCQAVMNLAAVRNIHGINPSLNDDDAIKAIETIINSPIAANLIPSPEERIAAALEFQNLLAM